jgi:L-erythrulose 1-phosphate isomerase
MKKKVWIGTNWKMTKTLAEGQAYVDELLALGDSLDAAIQLFVIPSYTSLYPLRQQLWNTRVMVGAQNMHWEERGAYTGEISPLMLREIGIDLVELGHSERRQYYNENDADINKKARTALRYGMTPLICIGENLEQKQSGASCETLTRQLHDCLKDMSEELASQVLIAYEPVWAIGEGGVPAEADYVAEIHRHIRGVLGELYQVGADIPILYGGSVNTSNFKAYLQAPDVNGLFIGRAAWHMPTFKEILTQVHSGLSDR